jgi:hypothetical protein
MPNIRADQARYLSDKITESFNENLKVPQVEEYKAFTTPKASTKDEEIYASFGNLLAAEEKDEGGKFHYDTAKEMFFTTVVNKTYDRGFSDTMEAVSDDPDKVLKKVETGGILKALIIKRERNVGAVVDAVFTSTAADGVYYASASHPLDTAKTALLNDNLMSPGAITPDNINDGCNKFYDIHDFAGNLMSGTHATAILANLKKQKNVAVIFSSNLKPNELSNTDNPVTPLKQIFGRYINLNYWHLLDENIPSFIFQRRESVTTLSDQDKIQTGNFYWNASERYRAAHINSGFGHVSNAYAG